MLRATLWCLLAIVLILAIHGLPQSGQQQGQALQQPGQQLTPLPLDVQKQQSKEQQHAGQEKQELGQQKSLQQDQQQAQAQKVDAVKVEVRPPRRRQEDDGDGDFDDRSDVTEANGDSSHEMCHVIPGRRTDCGYPGITEFICEHVKNCCYDSDIPDVPWCFHPRASPSVRLPASSRQRPA